MAPRDIAVGRSSSMMLPPAHVSAVGRSLAFRTSLARTTATAGAGGATVERESCRTIEDLAGVVHAAQGLPTSALLEKVRSALEGVLKNPDAIDPVLIRPRDDRYSRTLLYRDPNRRFLIALLTWSPGQKSPIHDHECWGAVGVVRGRIREVPYTFDAAGRLHPGVPLSADPGMVTTVHPPEVDLHTMENPTDGLAVSLHVYGRDMRDANVFDPATGAATRKRIGFDYAGPLAKLD